MEDTQSAAIRMKVFDWLQQRIITKGDVLSRDELKTECIIDGYIVPLLGPQGIFKPKIIQYYPISITTSPNSPYSDSISDSNIITYKYRGTDPNFHENMRLKRAMENKVPLIYFFGLIPGKYMVHFPAFITKADDFHLTFSVEVDISQDSIWNALEKNQVKDQLVDEVRRQYATREVVIRLHQRSFREKVLYAYRDHCAFCRLKHRELLDAAHIIPDNEGGPPDVNNGLSLCKIHHAAFDKNILGINEDFRIEVRKDVLEEVDGPMLKYGLQEFHHKQLIMPRSRESYPDKKYIIDRYERFRSAQ
jgi:putative restriction endonuclease